MSAFDFQLAPVNLVAAGGIEHIKVRAAESEIGDFAVRRRDDRVHSSGLIADLNAHLRRNVKTPVAVNTHAVGLAVVAGVGNVKPVIFLFVL